MDTGRRHSLPPMLCNQARDIGKQYRSAAKGHASDEHPVHVRCVWEDQDGAISTEVVWGLVTAWTETAMHVMLHRHGQWHAWMRREDVTPCTCTEMHEPGWWPAPDEGAALDGE